MSPAQTSRAALVLVLAALGFRVAADGAAAKPTAPADAQEARARLAKAQSPAEYAAMLDSFSQALPPSDSLALLNQGLASVGADYRQPLVIKAGDLALLLGLFDEAASSYVEAADLASPKAAEEPRARISPAAAALLIRAARCDLAAGDFEKALDISSRLALGTEDGDISAASRLVGAWALALQGSSAEARSAALSLAEPSVLPARRREARFILWLCTVDDKSSTAEEKDKAAGILASEFPGSPEALIASGSVSPPPLAHWYLGGLLAPAPASPAKSAAATATPPAAKSAVLPAASGAGGKRLQVGYFSVEDNAQAMKDDLASKGFSATVEARTRSGGEGKPDENRWIVSVDGGKDMAKTMQSLKDAGYEPYIVD